MWFNNLRQYFFVYSGRGYSIEQFGLNKIELNRGDFFSGKETRISHSKSIVRHG